MAWTVLYRDAEMTGFEPRALESAEVLARPYKVTGSTAVFAFDTDGRALVAKRRRATGLRRWRRSRAKRAIPIARALHDAGVATPRVRIACEKRCCGLLVASYLVSDRIEPAETLHARLARTTPGDPARLGAAVAIGEAIGRTFGAGFRNRDLKAPNLLIDDTNRAWVVDLDGVRRAGGTTAATRRRDLERLGRDVWAGPAPAPAEVRAFLRAYRRGIRDGRATAGA